MTMYRASREKQDNWNKKHGAAESRANAKLQAAKADAEFVAARPEIGTLIRGGRPMYYVNGPTYREARDPRALVEG